MRDPVEEMKSRRGEMQRKEGIWNVLLPPSIFPLFCNRVSLPLCTTPALSTPSSYAPSSCAQLCTEPCIPGLCAPALCAPALCAQSLPCIEPCLARFCSLSSAPHCWPCFLHLLCTESASISSSALHQPSSTPDPLSSAPPTAGNDVPLHASIAGNHTPLHRACAQSCTPAPPALRPYLLHRA
ncbi:hypothetical protein SLEP1_g3430 [Rubroshorea leprosula]|uniref:Uncharacterized protein n=1 Tax=Rubroshorea leprosula TaxID=152421 RepID=A0AAV5HU56_9ROSI|nr:hypothetical protein SLEP1_g3430 [Rubroshorea leprosula]